jgi:hypothetical protein
MNASDLKARNAISINDYISKYKNSIVEFTQKENIQLQDLTKQADKLLIKYPKLVSIPWKFKKLSNNIENGFPHTLNDTIFLSSIPSLQTLIHEKMHVYQRLYPIETTKLIHDIWGFQIKEKQENITNIRNNPDLNSFVYGKDDYYIVQLYNSENPTNLQDSATYKVTSNNQLQITAQDIGFPTSIGQVEHPYEMMACIIPQILFKDLSQDHSELVYNTIQWMNNYL